jgi:hypothetical protein
MQVTLFIFFFISDEYVVYNAAFGKPTSQSSNQNNLRFASFRAVDGCNSSYWSYGSSPYNRFMGCCSQTESGTDNYWSVDLLDELQDLTVTLIIPDRKGQKFIL